MSPGLIVHGDRSSHYASELHRELLGQDGLTASMSRKGNCWDNSVMERFFLSLKMERVWRRNYANQAEAEKDVADYIVGFYNSVRLHSKLGYQSPNTYERLMTEKELIGVSEKTCSGQLFGMAFDPKRAQAQGDPAYPEMVLWLRGDDPHHVISLTPKPTSMYRQTKVE